MSPTSRVRPFLSLRLPAVFLAVAVLVLPACSSSDDSDATPMDVRTVIDLVVESGFGIRGMDVDMSFDSSMALTAVQPVGSFSGQTCLSNEGSNFARLTCARDDTETFDAPATLWRLTFEHSSVVDPLDLVLGLDCLASDALGNTFPVACSVQ